MIERLQQAKGHVARIIPFDDQTVLMPLNQDEARRLYYMVDAKMKQLAETGDFPEFDDYDKLKTNLSTAMWMFTEIK